MVSTHKGRTPARGWAAVDDWVSLHAFHWGDLDLLLTQCVTPLVRGLEETGLLRSWFFQRSWEGGPNIRLRLLPAHPSYAEPVRRAALTRLSAHLAAHPAPAPVSAARYAASAAAFARSRGLPTYDRTVREPDSVAELPYVRDPDWYGHGEAVTAVERHFAQSSNLALALLTGNTDRQVRLNVVLGHLTMALAASGLNMADTARFMDPQAVLERARPSERRRIARSAQATYRARGGNLREQTYRLWTAAPSSEGSLAGFGPAAGAWSHSVRTLAARLTTLATESSYAPSVLTDPYRDTPWTGGGRRPGAETVAVHRVLSRAAHEFANRAGITAQQEAYLRLLLGQALHDQ